MSIVSQYLTVGLEHNTRTEVCDFFIEKTKDIDFATIAFTGVSGALISIPLADRLNKPVTVVRKEQSHSRYIVEGYIRQGMSYFIVDDQVESGATLRRIKERMEEINPTCECVGIYMYNQTLVHDEDHYSYDRIKKIRQIFNNDKLFVLGAKIK